MTTLSGLGSQQTFTPKKISGAKEPQTYPAPRFAADRYQPQQPGGGGNQPSQNLLRNLRIAALLGLVGGAALHTIFNKPSSQDVQPPGVAPTTLPSDAPSPGASAPVVENGVNPSPAPAGTVPSGTAESSVNGKPVTPDDVDSSAFFQGATKSHVPMKRDNSLPFIVFNVDGVSFILRAKPSRNKEASNRKPVPELEGKQFRNIQEFATAAQPYVGYPKEPNFRFQLTDTSNGSFTVHDVTTQIPDDWTQKNPPDLQAPPDTGKEAG